MQIQSKSAADFARFWFGKGRMPSTEEGPDVINSETTTTAAVSVTADKVETASYCLEVANIDDRSR